MQQKFDEVQMTTSATTVLPEGEPALRVIPMPADSNPVGDIFGGWVMAQVDLAGAIPALRRARARVVTVAVNSFVFKEPVSIGDLVSFYATVQRVGRTSITVDVQVFAQRYPKEEPVQKLTTVKVTEAVLTYVAIDKHGRPKPIPPE
jgi:acyl-CoA thioesterase YciA